MKEKDGFIEGQILKVLINLDRLDRRKRVRRSLSAILQKIAKILKRPTTGRRFLQKGAHFLQISCEI